MKIKVTIILLVIFLISSLVGVAFFYNKSNSIENELTNQLADNESVIANLQSTNTQLETNISELEQTIADLEQQLADLQSVNDELQATIADLEQITTQEEDYFKEAEELWEQYQDQMDVNWETFRETYTIERKDNGLSQQQALDKLLDLFKKVVEQPKQQQSSSSQQPTESSTPQSDSGNSGSSDNSGKLSPEAQAFWDSVGGGTFGDIPTAEKNTNGNYWGGDGITAQ